MALRLRVVWIGLALSSAAQGGPSDEKVWIELSAPLGGAVQSLPVAMIEVTGATGAGIPHYHDLAVVVDLSASTRLPSGIDVNENGRIGKSDPEIREDYWGSASPEELCDDAGDTIAAAEVLAVRRLLRLLDPTLTRVTLIAFGDTGEVMAPLAASRAQVIAAVDELDRRHGWYGGTNYSDALHTALLALRASPPAEGHEREQSILFLSDGYPTLPPPEPEPSKAAIAAGRAAGAAAMRIHSFALGPVALRGRDILALLSRVSKGSLTEIERPGEVLFHLPAIELSRIAKVEIENETAKQPARALRLLADGSFDGFVPLQAGRNVVRVLARGQAGGIGEERRVVFYSPAAGRTHEVELAVSKLRELLNARTIEMQLQDQIQRVRDERRRKLTIEVEKEAK